MHALTQHNDQTSDFFNDAILENDIDKETNCYNCRIEGVDPPFQVTDTKSKHRDEKLGNKWTT